MTLTADSEHDIIFVREHVFLMSIGVLEFEKSWRQSVAVSFKMRVPSSVRATGEYVSYAPVVEYLRELSASGRHIDLIETLAEDVGRQALADARVEAVEVTVEKRDVFPDAQGVGITILMTQGEQTA